MVAEQDQRHSTGVSNNIYYFDPTQKQPLPLTSEWTKQHAWVFLSLGDLEIGAQV